MGIDGLHSVLKPYLRNIHLRELTGARVGVDASSWLHRGAVSAAADLAAGMRPWEARGCDAPWVSFCLKMVRVVLAAGATPVLVFDGRRLPAKEATNAARRARREEAKARALQLQNDGREAEAAGVLQQSVVVTHEMAQELIARLRQQRVEFVVAPYEADAQLAHLSSLPEWQGGVAAVITEDSDLVGYGCRRVLFKMDGAGYCQELQLERLFAGPEAAAPPAGGAGGKGGGGVLSFKGWTLDMVQAACVLAGCDFLPSLKGVSFRTAAGFVARRRSLGGALKALRLEKRFQLLATTEYCAAAEQAALAFRHALAFCPNTGGGSCVRLTPAPEGADLAHVGAELAADVARGVAYGHLHPHTLEEYPAPAPVPPPQQTQTQTQGRPYWQRQSQQQQQQQPRQQPQRQQPQQQQHPSIASRRQSSWMNAGAARPASQQQHGLGPSRPPHPPPHPQVLAQAQRQWEGMEQLRSSQQQRQPPQQQQQQRGAGGASWGAGLQQQSQPPASAGSQDEAQTQAVLGSLASSGGGISSQQRQPMQPITNRPLAAGAPAATQGSVACASQAHAAAAPQAERVWDRAEQYNPQAQQPSRFGRQPQQQGVRSTPSPAAAGSKRKSVGGSSSSSKKAAAKPLAPASQRISRFFVPLGKRAKQ